MYRRLDSWGMQEQRNRTFSLLSKIQTTSQETTQPGLLCGGKLKGEAEAEAGGEELLFI